MGYRRLAGLILLLTSAATAAAQSAPPFGAAKGRFKTFVSSIGNFQLQYPNSNWIVTIGVPGAALTLVETRRSEALVVVERQRLRAALAANELPAAARTEADLVKDREPSVTDVRHQVIEAGGRQVIALQYGRVGIKGREAVVLYVIPIGDSLFRVSCSVVEGQLPQYAEQFGHIAASVQAPAAPSK